MIALTSLPRRFHFALAASLLLPGQTRLCAQYNSDVARYVPDRAPRTTVLADRRAAFRAYCKTGEGAKAFAKISSDFNKDYLHFKFPAEPLTYGDPEPKLRTSEKADKWRAVQDICGRISGVAEAATLIWLVDSEEKYLAKAKELLLNACEWRFAPDWESGPVQGQRIFITTMRRISGSGASCP